MPDETKYLEQYAVPVGNGITWATMKQGDFMPSSDKKDGYYVQVGGTGGKYVLGSREEARAILWQLLVDDLEYSIEQHENQLRQYRMLRARLGDDPRFLMRFECERG